MEKPVDQDNLDSQEEYYNHLNITSWKGRSYRRFFLYPLLNYKLKGKTLDVGCGIGSFLKSRKNSVGVDINPFNIEFCKSIGLEAYKIKDKFPFSDEEFDSIIFDNVLEHIEDPSFTFKEIYRVLKKDGRLIIGVPTISGYNSQADHRVFYDKKKLKTVTESHGFTLNKFFYTPFKSKYLENNMNAHCLFGVLIK